MIFGAAAKPAAALDAPDRFGGRIYEWSGAKMCPTSPFLNDFFDLAPESEGLLVLSIQPWSLADRNDIRPGDLITRVNDRPVRSPAELRRLIRALPADAPISVEVERAGEPLQLDFAVPIHKRPGFLKVR